METKAISKPFLKSIFLLKNRDPVFFAQTISLSAAMKMYQHRIQAGRGDGEAHHAAEDHGAAQHAQFVCHGHYVLHEPAIQVGRGLDPRDYYFRHPCNLPGSRKCVQSGAARHSQGFEDTNLGRSPGLLGQ